MSIPLYTEEELAAQRERVFPKEVLFSIAVPLYNTPVRFLREMIESVLAQTYGSWQLCLADGSDPDHPEVEEVCRHYARADSRILYRRLGENLGISGNSNACIGMGTGDYIALLDHDDILHPAALHDMMEAISGQGADLVYTDEATFQDPDLKNIVRIHFKPDFGPDTLLGNNYICHFTAFRRALLERTGGFRSAYDGSQDHDLMLRLTAEADRIVHIPRVLYYWRAHAGAAAESTQAKDYAYAAGCRAVTDSLRARGITAEAGISLPGFYRIRCALQGEPLVTIVIPTCDHVEELRRCLASVEEKTTYGNFEVILAENNSVEAETFAFYEEALKRWKNIRVVSVPGPFNYSRVNNEALKEAAGDYFLLLNNDTEVITPDWIQEMLMYAQRPDVGAVGAMLYYPDDRVQHAGVVLGLGGVAGHVFCGLARGSAGYMGRLLYARNLTAVTAACMMTGRDVWEETGGLNESFPLAFNDVDLCLRIRGTGRLIVWTPWAELYHHESASRGEDDSPDKKARFNREIRHFKELWGRELAAGDPCYNPNLTLHRPDCSPRADGHF